MGICPCKGCKYSQNAMIQAKKTTTKACISVYSYNHPLLTHAGGYIPNESTGNFSATSYFFPCTTQAHKQLSSQEGCACIWAFCPCPAVSDVAAYPSGAAYSGRRNRAARLLPPANRRSLSRAGACMPSGRPCGNHSFPETSRKPGHDLRYGGVFFLFSRPVF